MSSTDTLQTAGRVTRLARAEAPITIGDWYWTTAFHSDDGNDRDGKVLACVTQIGSNYIKLTAVPGGTTRVHLDHFDAKCTPTTAADAQAFCASRVQAYGAEAHTLMAEVHEITARLALSQRPTLGTGAEVQALALRREEPVEEYKAALLRAEKEQLPKLFERIKKANEAMATWMKGDLIALQAQAEGLEPVIKQIERRIQNVELYAGLKENVVCIREGAPAAIDEPIRLFQRRAYMDEECLARYEAGGMEFKDLGDFDAWMARPENADRLLPFPRCILAMQIRRVEKERHPVNLRDFIRIMFDREAEDDERTYLYMRNGERLYRLATGIKFGANLFPDLDRSILDGEVYAKYFTGIDEEIITKAHVEALDEEYVKKPIWNPGHDDKAPSAAVQAKRRKQVAQEDAAGQPVHLDFYNWVRWTPTSVYYDDITAVVDKQIQAHNRIVTVLQGLLDRSDIFHPHPPYQLWTPEGFAQAVTLIYDDSRALVDGPKPDFEAYRARLNASLKAGDVTVGQQKAWRKKEAEAQNKQHGWKRNWHDLDEYAPHGNPGPGRLAVVQKVGAKLVHYAWTRARREYTRWGPTGPLPVTLQLPKSRILNASAYTPGDYQQFYADPRTRADYLKWAPLLLTAEDYKAGKLKVQGGLDEDQ